MAALTQGGERRHERLAVRKDLTAPEWLPHCAEQPVLHIRAGREACHDPMVAHTHDVEMPPVHEPPDFLQRLAGIERNQRLRDVPQADDPGKELPQVAKG